VEYLEQAAQRLLKKNAGKLGALGAGEWGKYDTLASQNKPPHVQTAPPYNVVSCASVTTNTCHQRQLLSKSKS